MDSQKSTVAGSAQGSRPVAKKRLLKRVAIFLAGLLLAALAGEVVVRLVAPQPILPRFVEFSPLGFRRTVAHVDGFQRTEEFDCRFRTNSRGFRGAREYSPTPAAGILRLVTLGDAHTLGVGVADDETFSALVEKELCDRGHAVEVINMGVSGFGTAEELLQYRHVARDLEPDVVILGYHHNDPYDTIESGLFRIEEDELVRMNKDANRSKGDRIRAIPGYAFLEQHSHLAALARNLMGGPAEESEESEETNPSACDEYWSDELAYSPELTRLLLEALILEVTGSGTALLIVNIGHPRVSAFTIFPYDLALNDRSAILDLTSALDAGPEEGVPIFFETGALFTPRGHAVIARKIVDALPGIEPRLNGAG